MAYKYENRYIKYDLTPILRQNRISLMWNKDSEKSRSNSGTKFVPVKLYLVHRRSLEKISSYFDTFPVFTLIYILIIFTYISIIFKDTNTSVVSRTLFTWNTYITTTPDK